MPSYLVIRKLVTRVDANRGERFLDLLSGEVDLGA